MPGPAPSGAMPSPALNTSEELECTGEVGRMDEQNRQGANGGHLCACGAPNGISGAPGLLGALLENHLLR